MGARCSWTKSEELPVTLQVKFLRVLQDGEFKRIGSTRPIRVDVRVIAATNKDLIQAIAEKSFREDLFYRLNVIPRCTFRHSGSARKTYRSLSITSSPTSTRSWERWWRDSRRRPSKR